MLRNTYLALRARTQVLPQSILALMECLLLDVSVIVTSDHTWLLTDTCETLMSMMYPFKMKYSLPEYFPLVPADADVETRLDSPFNFCLGVRKDHLVRGVRARSARISSLSLTSTRTTLSEVLEQQLTPYLLLRNHSQYNHSNTNTKLEHQRSKQVQ